MYLKIWGTFILHRISWHLVHRSQVPGSKEAMLNKPIHTLNQSEGGNGTDHSSGSHETVQLLPST